MSGFRSKMGDFLSQYNDHSSVERNLGLRTLAIREYQDFLSLKGGPHKIEGLLALEVPGRLPEYINLRRSEHQCGNIIIEPLTKNQDGNYIVSEDPRNIQAYRCKITSGSFSEETATWDYEFTQILHLPPGTQIDRLHQQVDFAIRIKFSLAERILKGEDVSAEIAMYSTEQSFYRGGFGKIVEQDPHKEAYLRDALVSEIERVIVSKDHQGVKASKIELNTQASKVSFELKPNSFMQVPVRSGVIRVKKMGEHCMMTFSDLKSGDKQEIPEAINNHFELHGGRADLLYVRMVNEYAPQVTNNHEAKVHKRAVLKSY